MESNTIKILFFGQLTDITQTGSIQISDVRDSDEAIEKTLQQFPSLKNYTYVIALDKKIISSNTALKNNQSMAFMPPFSGG